MNRAVIAIGGNALSTSAEKQEKQMIAAVKALMPVLTGNHEVVLVHGNGPQVGTIHHAFELAARTSQEKPMQFCECTAMNEGGIGYNLEQAIISVLADSGAKTVPIATVLTRVVVDPEDPAFEHPDKPVGSFYTEKQARELMAKTGRTYGPDSGRGWRLMVPSPRGKHILEAEAVRKLAGSGTIVIAGGGAGIPVAAVPGGGYEAVEAVCDKDLTSAMLAQLIDADMLVILTAVDNVAINFGTSRQENLEHLTPQKAKELIREGQFPPGSMLPKVEACVEFASASPGNRAIIGNLQHAAEVLEGSSGTIIEQ